MAKKVNITIRSQHAYENASVNQFQSWNITSFRLRLFINQIIFDFSLCATWILFLSTLWFSYILNNITIRIYSRWSS